MLNYMGSILLLARVVLAAVFAVAGIAKLLDLAGSRKSLRDFGVPDFLARPFGLLLPLAELVCAGALLPDSSAWWGAAGVAALLILFIAGIGINLARGRKPNCHCFGQLSSKPVGRGRSAAERRAIVDRGTGAIAGRGGCGIVAGVSSPLRD